MGDGLANSPQWSLSIPEATSRKVAVVAWRTGKGASLG